MTILSIVKKNNYPKKLLKWKEPFIMLCLMKSYKIALHFWIRSKELIEIIMMHTSNLLKTIRIKWIAFIKNSSKILQLCLKDSRKNKEKEFKNYIQMKLLLHKKSLRLRLLRNGKMRKRQKKQKLLKMPKRLPLILKLRKLLHQKVRVKMQINQTLMFLNLKFLKLLIMNLKWVKSISLRDLLKILLRNY